jgi:Uma2 family endonuclease
MAEPLPKPWTLDDFLAWEEQQPERYEFVDGVVRMMVGGTAAHNAIAVNVTSWLHQSLRGSGCQVFSSDMKLVARATGEGAYPDVMVTCRPPAPTDTLATDPMLVAEVLSRSTADRDRGSKFEMYKAISSLRYYLLISQDRRLVDLYRRTDAGWDLVRMSGDGVVELPELGVGMPLDSIYENVPI